MFAQNLPNTPYWTVIFVNQRTDVDDLGYAAIADRMEELVEQQPGCLGFDSARDQEGFGITVSYWDSLDSIQAWKNEPEHVQARTLGREKWYAHYDLHVARVERSYTFDQSPK